MSFSARPPVPPHPPLEPDQAPQVTYHPRTASLRGSGPLVPPLPTNWSGEVEEKFDNEDLSQGDEWDNILVSPRPHRLPGGATDTAHSLEDSVLAPPFYPSPNPDGRRAFTPQPSPRGFAGPGSTPPQPHFVGHRSYPGYPSQGSNGVHRGSLPGSTPPRLTVSPAAPRLGPSPAPPMSNMAPPEYSRPFDPQQHQRGASLQYAPPHVQMQALSLGDDGASMFSSRSNNSMHRRAGSATSSASSTPLVAALPSASELQKTQPNETTDPAVSLSWIQSVLLLASLSPSSESTASSSGPTLATVLPTALSLLQALASSPSPLPLAYFLRGTLLSTGTYPKAFPRDPRLAFKDFEKAARAGYWSAWFRLGRDYEGVGDLARARDCFERGVRGGERSCLYRMGMANLLGQLLLPANPSAAIPLLVRAASLSTLEVPQPAYVLGMLLLGELPALPPLPDSLLLSALPQNSNITLPQHALALIQTSAFLHFAPAQYKLGYAYENAQLGLPYDPTLSVRYYSYASQGGELEADMALSKWFLCGAEGYFEKDEGLARTFAEKAARRGLASAEFAMGYYAEVGVGGRKDLDTARGWYGLAEAHGNADARGRLDALGLESPTALSRAEHETLTGSTLVRKRTQARESAIADGRMVRVERGGNGERRGKEAIAAAVRASSIRGTSPGRGLGAVKEQAEEEAPLAPAGSPPSSAGLPTTPRPPQRSPLRPAPAGLPVINTPPTTTPVPPAPAPAPSPSASLSTPPQRSAIPVETAHGRGYSLSETILPSPNPATPASGGAGTPKKGPATFEEMGFYSTKLDNEKCVVM